MKRALLVAALAALVLPGAASAHAVLLRTQPISNKVLPASPADVALNYSEPVEPRFAIISVTNAAGQLVTSGPPHSAGATTVAVPVRTLQPGWYLVYWRVISSDGHPVRGAFTFAVGPNAGPPPQFVIPSTSETAATPGLVVARWIVFLSVMAAIGLFVLRMLIVRPVPHLRWVAVAWGVAIGLALVATPIYADLATAKFTLRSALDLGALVPVMRASAFGRGLLDLELCLLLFAYAGAVALAFDQPERPYRTVAAVLALTGALAAAGAALLVLSTSGHAGQTSPRGLAIPVDWLHFAAGSIWIGGLIGLLVLAATIPAAGRIAGLVVAVPRFSNVAFVSVLALLGSGIGNALFHLPTLSSLWQTSYGKVVILKIALLLAAMLVAAVNLLRNKPRLAAAERRRDLATGAGTLLRRLVGVEVLLVAAAIFGAALVTSLAPPSKALAKVGSVEARLGPGPGTRVIEKNGYRLDFRVAPNRAAIQNRFTVRITRNGSPVRDVRVTTTFAMLDMEMGEQSYAFREISPGVYARSEPALVMVGHWGISLELEPPGGKAFSVTILDKAGG